MDDRPALTSVFTAADPAQGQAIVDALIGAGIDARIIGSDDGVGGFALEIFVGLDAGDDARRVIAAGNWPRLA